MPAKNIVKFYIANSIYHIYNRGVEKRKIFMDEQDHKVFLTYLKEYLSAPLQGETLQSRSLWSKYFSEIELLAFCLMPNHVHLLIKQKNKDSIKKFTQSIFTRYTMYFNKKYDRTGSLFQGAYRATNVVNKDYLLDITRYIHRNPLKITKKLTDYYSSYAHYLNFFNIPWLKNKEVLDYFNESSFIKSKNIKSYKEFVEDFKYINEELDLTHDLAGFHPAS
ncbi:hypothetical protein A2130_03160 [Candidatus Woesebacteria bacterium GWC2_33_12]|uniref:Putative transposase n=1 Tax=Candidatus Woesebacteria bacterium GW2011_GWB1_33_22 TaxID=1618566 RepID=A0A0G0BXP2_9BACT|nr:MAG: putative transposase [Candidatus Woesebacteria bacterium GW2011_GWC2_33_12]KKP41391.1 MAG: putative transposase [Candidatus Woesebacteria bacterium GW2011_GWA2_33_20]KKP43645.1 MAG: putative transposase [Candidatus Woesebacteria bacterium GW2011_GWB1_33_22]KKP45138.1 MAG: hypothetical protein UR37_C0020G0007 [Microgenomates group bacterium GW2011_GWC1_33_28]KKP49174.1 MAG: putative transposase [Candidatus Woesebacteria bacterium GW2011_GWA1_33_33]OGM07718.1 MAG: hypothetical protein A2